MITIPKTLPKKITDKYSVLNNTFIREDKGEKAEEREVEIGDVHSDDFQPQVKLKQWENETNFSVRLIDDEKTKPKIETKGNKVKFIKKDRECHFYGIKEGFEFEVILKKKPKTNLVQMSIETKGLKFYYQPELADDEEGLAEMVKQEKCTLLEAKRKCRPENVVGSYAVYHESKQGDYSKMGLKNYKVGKVFHIYRPKIIDSAGKEVWGKLNIDIKKKLLTVEIPQEFLDNAVYPVKHAAGLMLGYTTAGSSNINLGGNTIRGIYPFTASASGPITQTNGFSYSRASNAATEPFRPVIYKNSDDTIVDYGPEESPSSAAGTFTTNFNQSGSLVNGTEYIVGLWLSGFSCNFKYDTTTNIMARDAHTYHATNAPPSTCAWDAGKPWGNTKVSIYAIYTASSTFTPKAIWFT